ncbi:MAG: DUF4032 domain-containing protein [Ktedonobacterales bacterium]
MSQETFNSVIDQQQDDDTPGVEASLWPIQHATVPSDIREVHLPRTDWWRLRSLPWGIPLEEWREHDVQILTIRRGESRHEVIFVETGGRRYAIKETSPSAAEKEITVFQELQRRRCRTLEPVGWLVTGGEPISIGEVAGQPVYMSGDTGYCITRLAERVLPQSILYRYPFTDLNKRLLWNAIAELLFNLHESGVYWGDPSLANILMDLSGQRLTAVMADAETADVVSGELDEGLRRQDLDSFVESLQWQAEDIRIARDLPEEQHLITTGDAEYLLSRYAGLRAYKHRPHLTLDTLFSQMLAVNRRIDQLNELGYGVLKLGIRALRPVQTSIESGLDSIESIVPPTVLPAVLGGTPTEEPSEATERENQDVEVATLRPGWYVQRLCALLGVHIPRPYARRIYHHINVHKWVMSEQAGHDVGMETTARDWYQNYHLPLLAFLDTFLPHADIATTYEAYAAILDHTWDMSIEEHRPVPIEEGAMDYALGHARAVSEKDWRE